VIEALDLCDDHASPRELERMLKGLIAEKLQELLLQIERDGVSPVREKAIELVAQYFGKRNPRAALAFATGSTTMYSGGAHSPRRWLRWCENRLRMPWRP
jgi:hypothetical protein